MMFGMVVAQVINAITGTLFSVREMAVGINGNLTLLALAPIPLAIAAVLIIGRKIQSRSRRAQELFSTLSGHLQENINGMRVLKAFAQEDAQYIAFEAESEEKRLANTRLYNTYTLLHPLIQVIFGLSYLAGIAYGGQLVVDKVISLSDYVAFNAYLTYIVFPVMSIGRISNMLQRGLASFKRVSAIMNEPELDPVERVPDNIPIRGGIEARGLSFTYPGSPAPALDGLNFSLSAGGVLGIAGPTGSGKSTVMMLMTKLLAPAPGQLFIDGRDIAAIPAASIRLATGYVPQDGFMFNVTLRENIDFFSGAGGETIARAAASAGLAPDIEAMPEGFETLSGERGSHLSGGQRQRAALARALARNPRILLLDDTLSAVDSRTEARILGALEREFIGCTVIITSHKLSALRRADYIIYLDNGRVTEEGTHDELIARGGAYASMYGAQAEGAGA
jgi:ATP-binding cassette subfamily B protein